jgi:uncharacterized protein (TIGR01777 family)
MKILLAGASGFLGTALRRRLGADGHQTHQLVRREPSSADQTQWDPYRSGLTPSVVDGFDVVVNLAGAPIAHWPLTASYRRTLRNSRTVPTTAIANAIAASDRKPALVNQSAIGLYGDRGDQLVDEDTPPGDDFLAGIVRDWEASTVAASDAGARVAITRTAIVLHADGSILGLMKWPWRFGLGARIGSGRQWFPTISLRDYLEVTSRLVADETMGGPYVVVAPTPATSGEFTRELARKLHRPRLLVVPEFAVRLAAGDVSEQVLGSIKATPRRLLDAGHEFADPTLRDQLDAAFA